MSHCIPISLVGECLPSLCWSPMSSAVQYRPNWWKWRDDLDGDGDDDEKWDDDLWKWRHHRRIKQIMSMSIMKKVSISRYSIFMNKFFTARNTRHHLVIALITIMKQATTLRPSGLSSQSALAQAESGYQKSNIHSQTALYFPEAPQQYSVQQYVDFIMDAHLCSTDIKWFAK